MIQILLLNKRAIVLAYAMLQSALAVGSQIKPDTSRVNKIYINVRYKEAKPNDTLSADLINMLDAHWTVVNRGLQWKRMDKDGLFKFILESRDDQGYFSLNRLERNNADKQYGVIRDFSEPMFWEKGDSITINISHVEQQAGLNNMTTFSGRGSEKYNIAERTALKAYETVLAKFPSGEPYHVTFDDSLNFQPTDKLWRENQLQILEKYKADLSYLSYGVIRAKVIFGNSTAYPLDIRQYVEKHPVIEKSLMNNYQSSFGNLDLHGIDSSCLAESSSFMSYLFNKYTADSYVFKGKDDPLFIYNAMKSALTGKLRDNAIIYSFLTSTKRNNNADSIFRDARSFIKDPRCIEELNKLENIYDNKSILNYSLLGLDHKPVSLSKFKGKVIVIDFWFNYCGGCAKYYSEVLSKIESQYKGITDVVFLSISADYSDRRWMEGLNSGEYTSKHAVNLRAKNGFRDLIIKDNSIFLFPSAMLIGKDGKIKHFNSANLYKLETLKDAIEANR